MALQKFDSNIFMLGLGIVVRCHGHDLERFKLRQYYVGNCLDSGLDNIMKHFNIYIQVDNTIVP